MQVSNVRGNEGGSFPEKQRDFILNRIFCLPAANMNICQGNSTFQVFISENARARFSRCARQRALKYVWKRCACKWSPLKG